MQFNVKNSLDRSGLENLES